MPEIKSPIPLNLIALLLNPIQKVIQAILPDFVENGLKSPDVRDAMVLAADEALVLQYPFVSAVPIDVRRSLIRKQLDLIIDEILLNDALPAKALEGPARMKKPSSPSPRRAQGRAPGKR